MLTAPRFPRQQRNRPSDPFVSRLPSPSLGFERGRSRTERSSASKTVSYVAKFSSELVDLLTP